MEYDAVIDFVADHISFIIPGLPGNPYPFNEAKKYMTAIKEMTAEDLKKECIIDKIIIHYKDKSLTAEVWFRDGEGNKHKQLKKLWARH